MNNDELRRLLKSYCDRKDCNDFREEFEEKEWNQAFERFYDQVVAPAYKGIQEMVGEFEGLTAQLLEESPSTSLSITDGDCDLLVAIQIAGRQPRVSAWRRRKGDKYLTKVPTPQLHRSSQYSIEDVTSKDVRNAFEYAFRVWSGRSQGVELLAN